MSKYSTDLQVRSVPNTATQLLGPSQGRRGLRISAPSASDVYIGFGFQPTATNGFPIRAGGPSEYFCESEVGSQFKLDVWAICAAAGPEIICAMSCEDCVCLE